MKLKMEMEIEMTPQEYREAMGLPNVAPFQERILEKMEQRIEEVSDLTDPVKCFSSANPFFEMWKNIIPKMTLKD